MNHLKIMPNAPNLTNHINRGGSFKDWRHNFTNYDNLWPRATPARYKEILKDFFELAQNLDGEAKTQVINWLKDKLDI